MKSFMASPSTIERKWYVVDATGHTLGRLASEIASILRGKNKPTFTPHIDTGDYVIVVNADKIQVTGKKLDQKVYYQPLRLCRWYERDNSSVRRWLRSQRMLSTLQLRECFQRDHLADR